jgi:hypothetical protein
MLSSMALPNHWTLDEVLALSLVPRMRAVDLRRLVDEYDSLAALLQAAPPELMKAKIFSATAEQDSLFAGSRSVTGVFDSLMNDALAQMTICQSEDIHIVSYWRNILLYSRKFSIRQRCCMCVEAYNRMMQQQLPSLGRAIVRTTDAWQQNNTQ